MTTTQTAFKASVNPSEDLSKISYLGQPYRHRMYKPGYERFFNQMPKIDPENFDEIDLKKTQRVLGNLSEELRASNWLRHATMEPFDFARTVIAIEAPTNLGGGKYKENAELIVAQWGEGNTSPVHGHASGYMHEEILFGKVRVNTYRLRDNISNIVLPVETKIVGPGVFVSEFQPERPDARFTRQTLIHNFTAIQETSSLHYLPEHTRDGRDNTFEVEYFETNHPLTKSDVERITSLQGMYLRKGEVVLVRSLNVPEYGDHYIVITGAPTMKEHGLRPRDTAIGVKGFHPLLDQFQVTTGLILLKLKPFAAEKFREFHGIEIVNDEVVFPTA